VIVAPVSGAVPEITVPETLLFVTCAIKNAGTNNNRIMGRILLIDILLFKLIDCKETKSLSNSCNLLLPNFKQAVS
jgi:hypothetical protein